MPHYKDGTEAKRGDLVRGKGYNVRHEIQGIVVDVTPGSDACNVKVAHLKPLDVGKTDDPFFVPYIDIEYGQADAFEKVS